MTKTTDDLINEFLLNGGKVTQIKRKTPTLSQRDWKRLQRAPEGEREKVRALIEQEHAMKRALSLKPLSKKMKS